jgi:Domain of unknown function (DUF1918)
VASKKEVRMHADIGDELVVESLFCGGAPRKGEILDVRVEGGHEHYIVRWDDNGHETLFFPGRTTHVMHTHRGAALGGRT